jgi:hypothetical protein
MSINDSRSMNEQLKRGMLDGTVRNMRPDSAAADYTDATIRARQLHPSHYGTFGQGSDDITPHLEEFLPDAAVRLARRNAGIKGY